MADANGGVHDNHQFSIMKDQSSPFGSTGLFADSSIDRRSFIRLTAATAGAVTLPGNATSDTSSHKFTETYQYVLNHTPPDYAVPTLVRFSSPAGLSAIDAAIEGETITTTEPEPAAFSLLTTAEADSVASLPTAETMSHSPGSNPFWRLGYYPMGVFPEAERSVDFIDYEQMIDGMRHLEADHSERLDFYSIGTSPGFENAISGRDDPKDVYIAEITNDISDQESYEAKTKVLYSLSIHGVERQGAEAGTRFVENILTGREPETEALLDEAVLIFIYPNPDGWVAPHPQYPSQPTYKRGNAEVGDTNRQFPVTGWINPAHHPAEPDGANLQDDQPGVDPDVPDEIAANVPDALAMVEHLRDYDNLSYGADFHGAAHSRNFVFGLISQDQFSHVDLHALYEMNHAIDESMSQDLAEWNTAADVQESITGDENVEVIDFGVLPEQAYDWASIWDTVKYTDSGFVGDWFAHPEELGGLGMTTMDLEMTYSSPVFVPRLVDMWVRGFQAVVRGLAEYAVQNSDTPNTRNEFDASIETGGNATAYVTTDALTRSSDDLSFVGDEGTGSTRRTSAQHSATLDPDEPARIEFPVPEDTHTQVLQVTSQPDRIDRLVVRRPSGDDVARFSSDDDHAGSDNWLLRSPDAGRLIAQLDGDIQQPQEVTLAVTTLQSTDQPDPSEAIGFEQRDYKVSPFTFFDKDFVSPTDDLSHFERDVDYDDVADASIDPLPRRKTRRRLDTQYENLVVIHDAGIDDQKYIEALDEFVSAGGNLVLTDTGVNLLGAMENDLAAGVTHGDIERNARFYVAHIQERIEGHPLLEGSRPIQQQLWKPTPLGYGTGSTGNRPHESAGVVTGPVDASKAPMTLVSNDAFEAAGGAVAGRTDGAVSAGTLCSGEYTGTIRDLIESEDGTIHIIGGLFPPATQANLHPFGLLDYSHSFLGHTMLTNALGYVQKRSVGGDVVKVLGGESTFDDPSS